MSNYKKGDITQDGWEVLDVVMKPIYKMKKRVTINDDALEHNETFIKDMIYGIGLAVNGDKFKMADGYKRFEDLLLNEIINQIKDE